MPYVKTSLRDMNARRRARQVTGITSLGEGSRAQVAAILGLERAAEKKAADVERRARDEAAEAKARAERVREEERKALLAKALKVPAGKERERFLEEEQLVAKAREAAVKLKRGEVEGDDLDVASVFGIQVDE